MTSLFQSEWLLRQVPGLGSERTSPDSTHIWDKGTQFVLSLLILTILLGLTGGVIKTFLELRLLLTTDIDVALRHVIVNTLTLLAVIEVLKTTLAYFSEGRVRVTFIVDTVLVVMLTEIISQWFTGGDWQKLALLAGILLTLGVIRVVAVRFSPVHQAGIAPAQQSGLGFTS